MTGIEGEAAADAVGHAGHGVHLRGERGLVDAEDLRAEACQHPRPAAGGRTEIKAEIAGAGAFGEQGERLPELEVGPARRIDLVFMEVDRPVGERRGAPGRGEDQVGFPQGPRTERGRGRGIAEVERLFRHVGELFLNERGAAVVFLGMQVPVALNGGEPARAVADGLDGKEYGGFPDVLGPCGRTGRALGQHEPSADFQNVVPEFDEEVFEKSLYGEIYGKGNRNGGCVSRNGGGGGIFFHKGKEMPLTGKMG